MLEGQAESESGVRVVELIASSCVRCRREATRARRPCCLIHSATETPGEAASRESRGNTGGLGDGHRLRPSAGGGPKRPIRSPTRGRSDRSRRHRASIMERSWPARLVLRSSTSSGRNRPPEGSGTRPVLRRPRPHPSRSRDGTNAPRGHAAEHRISWRAASRRVQHEQAQHQHGPTRLDSPRK